MDNFAEQIVKRNMTKSEKSKRSAVLVCGVIVTILLTVAAMLMLASPLIAFAGLVFAAGAGYGTYFYVQNTDVEYEYTFTNGELDIDKIIAKKRRKSLVSIDISKFADFGRYEDSTEETDDMTVVIASNNIAQQEYYADFPHEEYGSTRLIFCPNEKMLENINKFLPRALRTR